MDKLEQVLNEAGYETTRLDRATERENPTWGCKIGLRGKSARLPGGCDAPMREAVERAFKEITGIEADFCFSGWDEKLTQGEIEVLNEGS